MQFTIQTILTTTTSNFTENISNETREPTHSTENCKLILNIDIIQKNATHELSMDIWTYPHQRKMTTLFKSTLTSKLEHYYSVLNISNECHGKLRIDAFSADRRLSISNNNLEVRIDEFASCEIEAFVLHKYFFFHIFSFFFFFFSFEKIFHNTCAAELEILV